MLVYIRSNSEISDERGVMRTVPALDRGLVVLQLLADAVEPQSASQLAEQAGIPRSAIYEILNTLQSRDFVQVSSGTYKLGPTVAALGNRFLERIDFIDEATQAARELSKLTGETSQVGVLDGRHVVYIAKADSNHQIRLISSVGRKLPANCTALGKSMLAQLSEEEIDELYRQEPPERLTERSLNLAELRTELNRIRSRGYAYEHGESNENVSCFAVAFDTGPNENRLAALSVSVLSINLSNSREEELVQAVQKCAHQLIGKFSVGKEPFFGNGTSPAVGLAGDRQ